MAEPVKVKIEKQDDGYCDSPATDKGSQPDPDGCESPHDPDAEVKVEEEEGEVQEPLQWSHQEAMAILKSSLSHLMQEDPLLQGLPEAITLEEINLQIALEYGRAMTVYLYRDDGQILPVVVVQNGSVLDLKKAIQRHVMLKQNREGGTMCISWRYIWRTYWLVSDGQKLTEDNKALKEYGVRNLSEVNFVRRLRSK